MSFFGDLRHTPAPTKPPGAAAAGGGADPTVPLQNLANVQARMDSLQKFLSTSVTGNILLGEEQMGMVSSEIAAAIHQIIVNGAALLASTQAADEVSPHKSTNKRLFSETETDFVDQNAVAAEDGGSGGCGGEDWEIIELDAVELLAEHIHFCEICGKGFKRDANLRMHMRAHGNQFKTVEALAKPGKCGGESGPRGRNTRFSCPFIGCSRNKNHNKFRPLKSAICVKNHFRRSHCPKMYSCNRCHKKSFSVLADLKSHAKHCGETKWKCSCGTNFSRKDKLFGHMALFEGHMPAVEDEKAAAPITAEDDEEEDSTAKKGTNSGGSDNGFLDRLLKDDCDSIDNYCFQEILGWSSPNAANGLVDTFIQGYQVRGGNGSLPSFMLPPIPLGHSNVHHIPQSVQGMRGHNINFPPMMAASSSRHSTNAPLISNMNPFPGVVETGTRYMGALVPAGVRLYRPVRRGFMVEANNVWHRNIPNLRFMPEDGVTMLEIPGYYNGIGDSADQHSDMRMDIDHMSYEELLALGEQIGSVTTGLSEEFITSHLKTKPFTSSKTSPPSKGAECSDQNTDFCVVCQNDYKDQESIGTVECGHAYHVDCITKWLVVKNSCPICKSIALPMEQKDL